MSFNTNILEDPQGLSEPSCSPRIIKTNIQNDEHLDFSQMTLANGDISERYAPNNNLVYDNLVTTECSVVVTKEARCEQAARTLVSDEGESEDVEAKESDDTSLNQSEDANSLKDDTTSVGDSRTSSQTPEGPNDFSDHEMFDAADYNNGLLKKNKKTKKTSGPGRGRPRKTFVAMYHSQISGDKNAIKIRIKKSNFSTQAQLPPNKRKTARRKKHKASSDTDASDYEKKPAKKSRSLNANENDVSSTQEQEPLEQSPWGDATKMPPNVLTKIFEEACAEGSLPTAVRLCKVCRLWRDTSSNTSIWKKADLNYVKEKLRTDLRLHWLILNKLTKCQDISMGEWKVRDIQAVLEALAEHCTELKGLNLSGWKGLNSEHLKYLTTECKSLQRIDLSSINVSNSASAINAQPLVSLSQTMNTRLTHLVLAHNKIAAFTQIISSIASHCPNLELLDISNIRTFAHNTALLHVEKLQVGCPKLKVLRLTNSQIWLAPTTLTEQVGSPGFPMLEELSLAGLEEDKTTTSRSMDDEGIERLLKTSTKLRLLDVRGCTKLTDSGLVRVPAWDLEHLFLSACYITRLQHSGLELILQKWSHSLLEVDLAWSTATESLDNAVMALAEKGVESKLQTLNLCGSSVSLEPVKAILTNCMCLRSINLQSCRALPRGVKRLYTGSAVQELRRSLLEKAKTDGGGSPGDDGATPGVSPTGE